MQKTSKSPYQGAPSPVRAEQGTAPPSTTTELIPSPNSVAEGSSTNVSLDVKIPGLRVLANWTRNWRRA